MKIGEKRHVAQLFHRDQAGANPVVDVVGVVGNLISKVAQLRLKAGLAPIEESSCHATGLGGLDPMRVRPRAVLEDSFTCLESQIQAVVPRVALLQLVDHPQALQVVLETALS